MKMILLFTHPQAILGVYDFLLSDESNQSYIKNCPDSSLQAEGFSVTQSKTHKRTIYQIFFSPLFSLSEVWRPYSEQTAHCHLSNGTSRPHRTRPAPVYIKMSAVRLMLWIFKPQSCRALFTNKSILMIDKVKGLSVLQVKFQSNNVTSTNVTVRRARKWQYCMQKCYIHMLLLNCSGFCPKTLIRPQHRTKQSLIKTSFKECVCDWLEWESREKEKIKANAYKQGAPWNTDNYTHHKHAFKLNMKHIHRAISLRRGCFIPAERILGIYSPPEAFEEVLWRLKVKFILQSISRYINGHFSTTIWYYLCNPKITSKNFFNEL